MNLKGPVTVVLVCLAGVVVANPPLFQLNYLTNAYKLLKAQIANCTGNVLCDIVTFDKGLFESTVTCLPKSKVCDHKLDCSLGVDEVDCGPECNNIRCQDRRNCATPCNEPNDDSECADGEDERGCPAFCDCPKGSYRCLDCVTCVPRIQLCDGTAQCPGGDDETNCPNNCRCNDGDLRCSDGTTCVPKSQICDGAMNCPGNEDEQFCGTGCQCGPNSLICLTSGKCLPRAMVCNGVSNECCDGDIAACMVVGNEELMCTAGIGAG